MKLNEEYSIRCEYMSIITCKSKTLTSLRVIQYKGFRALFEYMKWKKYVKVVMARKCKELKELRMKRALQAWQKDYKAWKVVKTREDFDNSVKTELKSICAQYNKEIDTLR